ncbi:MAG: GntR family transcriptional regulator [Chloroflexi bacterium]|nr:GntR family transcriptional regulator [Chloroflexota bacterium]
MKAPTVPPVGQLFQSLSERVYWALVESIVQWRFQPGQRLVLEDLAEQLRVSRTPVRDALTRLATLGLVEPTGRRGFCVTVLTAGDLMYLYEMRLMCELFAVQKGLDNLTSSLLVQMEVEAAECARLNGSQDPADWLASLLHDRTLHGLLVNLALNPRLVTMYERLNVHIHGLRAGRRRISPEAVREVTEREHNALLAALRGGDRATAQEAITSHVTNARDRAIASLTWNQAGEREPPFLWAGDPARLERLSQ